MNYINIPLEKEPNIVYIDLNLRGGWWSDIIVSDSDNNFYSVELVKKIFGPHFIIEPDRIEHYEEIDEEYIEEDVEEDIETEEEIIEEIQEEDDGPDEK